MEQQTLSRPFGFSGVGIHSGVEARVTVHPAEPGAGRIFSTEGLSIPARVDFVVDTTRSTTLGRDGARIGTVEHLLSALAGCGIDNCRIEVDGPEIPILDGSGRPFVEAINDAGIQRQSLPARTLRLREAVTVTAGASVLRAEPAAVLGMRVATEFDEWPEGQAAVTIDGSAGMLQDYSDRIAPARTFAFRREVDMLIAAGLARGGSLDNALIISPPDTFSSPLRVPLEWCAHKMLDLIGDLALLDARLVATIDALRPGHRINTLLAQAIFAQCNE